jgi:hypothetical protein
MYSHRRQAETQVTTKKPVILDTCFALASHSPVVEQHWPLFYQPKEIA